jgi:CPA2 family monovalent cation:H+ antiporter-2
VAALARLFGAAPGVALRTGLYLAQAGEFGFVLLTLGAEQNLVAPEWMSPVLASMVLSMLATPFIIMYSRPAWSCACRAATGCCSRCS